MTSRINQLSLLVAVTLFFIVSCSENSTSADQPEPPAVPEALPAEINNTLFENQNLSGSDYQTFNQASSTVWIAKTQLDLATSLAQYYLNITRSAESKFEDGTWIWSFSHEESDINVSVRIQAQELQNGYQWDQFVSGSFGGETVSEFLVLTGFISKDGSSGNWQTFSPDFGDQEILEYNWEVIDDSSSTFSAIFPVSSNGDGERFDYVKNGVENTLEYDGFYSDAKVTIYWNSETKTGYIDTEGEDRRCWDESFAETACS